MARTKSSKQWLKRHFDDPYVKLAQKEGVRSRAVYKLLEIQEKNHLIKPGMNIIDLGAAPGGWSEAAVKLLKGHGKVFALDILPMDPLQSVEFIQGDFRDDEVLQQLLEALQGKSIDLVMSDMAPNFSGQKQVDQPRIMYLAELALDFALKVLSDQGAFLVKVFQGEGFDEYLKQLKTEFASVVARKPKASRSGSREVYLLAKR